MARAGLGWSAHDLADKAGVGYATVARFESGGTISDESLEKIADALMTAGVSLTNAKRRVGVSVPDKA
jgi:transcriptional regulator with XRE-family HTH domain